MASLLFSLILILTLLFLDSSATVAPKNNPRAIILPLKKDPITGQHVATIVQGTPRSPVKLTVDLSGKSVWLDCDRRNHSSTYREIHCHTPDCDLHSTTKFCPSKSEGYHSTCGEFVANTITGIGTGGDFSRDVVFFRSTDGVNPGRVDSVAKFYHTCVSGLGDGLARGVIGMAGLGWVKTSVPVQVAAAFKFPRKFAVCFGVSGFVIFGDVPISLLPSKEDLTARLIYSPIIRNRVDPIIGVMEDPSPEYYINVTSIIVGGKVVELNTKLLAINGKGIGGTKISSVLPYTAMESSIYKAVEAAFVAAWRGRTARVSPVAPFKACFNRKGVGSTRAGPAVPYISLVLGEEKEPPIRWGIFGSNSMVTVSKDVICLAFVDAGQILGTGNAAQKHTTTAIEIGRYQIEDNLIQFDLEASRIGFSSSLLYYKTNCSNFNFTSVA